MIKIALPRKGESAERLAEQYLRQQQLKFITRNFNCRQGEIDLIFADGETIIFVEVRHRSANHYGSALATVTRPKQQKIMKAATVFLLKNGWYDKKSIRFDVIAINGPLHAAPQIEWIKQAFY
jgi:putative endonuclease